MKNRLLEKLLTSNSRPTSITPRFFSIKKTKEAADLKHLLSQNSIDLVDTFHDQIEELFMVRHPFLRSDPKKAKELAEIHKKDLQKKLPFFMQGRWVYLAWNRSLVHILDSEDFYELRTSRNRDLITKQEQEVFRNKKIGIAGLSVGNSVAISLVLEGGGEHMRLADFDHLSIPNLNRIRSGVSSLGVHKGIIAARQIYEINPYAKIDLFLRGIDEGEMKKFFQGSKNLDIIIDEMDDIVMKIKIREMARKLRIPLISAADNGDSVIVDVERYDREPRRLPFHGLIKGVTAEKAGQMSFGERIGVINSMVGIDFVEKRMKDSLLQVGTTLYSWPQLGGAAALAGGALAYVARSILLGEKIQSGKYDVSLSRVFVKNHDAQSFIKKRRYETRKFLSRQKQIFG